MSLMDKISKPIKAIKSKSKRTVYSTDPEEYGYKYNTKTGQYELDEQTREEIGVEDGYTPTWDDWGGDILDDELAIIKEYFDHHDGPFLLYGTIGLWDGRRIGGDIIRDYNEFVRKAIQHDYDHELEVYDENGELNIVIHHHDGTHHMVLRELTKKGRAYYDHHADYDGYVSSDEFHHLAKQKGYTRRANFADEMYGKMPKKKE